MQNKKNKTLILTFSGIAVFIIGAILGSFLVLRSGSSEGKEFYIKKDSNKTAGVVSLLDELRNGGNASLYSEFEENFTQQMVEAMIQESIQAGVGINEIGEDFFEKAAKAAELQDVKLFPVIEDSDINVSEEAKEEPYLIAVNEHFRVLKGVFNSIYLSDASDFEKEQKMVELFKLLPGLIQSTEETKKEKVPPQYVQFHKDVISFSIALRRTLEEGILRIEEDPIASAIIMNKFNSVIFAAQELDRQFAVYLESTGQ